MSAPGCSIISTNRPAIRSSSRCPAISWWSAPSRHKNPRVPCGGAGILAGPAGALLGSLALAGLLQIALGELPIGDLLEEGRHVVRPPVLIIQIVGMLPHVEREERRLAIDQRRIGVGGGGDLQLAIRQREPSP